jgi:hypothetical protein
LGEISFDKDPALGYVDVDGILAELNRRPFKDWPVQKILDCPNTHVYQGARQILASRMVPYLRSVIAWSRGWDVKFEVERIEFITETMDNELAVLIDGLGLEPKITNVMLGYCAGAKKIVRMFDTGPRNASNTAQDLMLGLAASMKIQADFLQLLGFEIRPRDPSLPPPFSHDRPIIPP